MPLGEMLDRSPGSHHEIMHVEDGVLAAAERMDDAGQFAVGPIVGSQIEGLPPPTARPHPALHERDATRPASSWSRTSAGFHIIVNGLSGNKVLDMLCRALLDIHAERTQTEMGSVRASAALATRAAIEAGQLSG